MLGIISRLLGKIGKLLELLGPRNVRLLESLINAVLKSPNKANALRAAAVAAGHQAAADLVLAKILKKRKAARKK